MLTPVATPGPALLTVSGIAAGNQVSARLNDPADQVPIPNKLITFTLGMYLGAPSATATTDANGAYLFTEPPGTYTVAVTADVLQFAIGPLGWAFADEALDAETRGGKTDGEVNIQVVGDRRIVSEILDREGQARSSISSAG